MLENNSASLDFSPVAALLDTQYQGDPKEAAAQLYGVSQYLMKVPNANDTAAYLREVVAVVNDLATAFDSMSVVKP